MANEDKSYKEFLTEEHIDKTDRFLQEEQVYMAQQSKNLLPLKRIKNILFFFLWITIISIAIIIYFLVFK